MDCRPLVSNEVVIDGLPATRQELENPNGYQRSMSASAIGHKPRMDHCGSPDYIEDPPNPGGPAASVFVQQDQRIDGKSALRRNPSGQQAQRSHRENDADQHHWIARCRLIDDRSENPAG